MKTLFVAFTLMSQLASAHCPLPLNLAEDKYCLEVQWPKAEVSVQGNLQETSELSPQLIRSGTLPSQRLRSRALVAVWRNGDVEHRPVQLPEGARVFPYMVMSNGHHHSTSHTFTWLEDEELYELRNMALQEMPGCWSLRWTSAETLDLASSQLLQLISPFENLSVSENQSLVDLCQDLQDTPGDQNGHQHLHP